MVNNRDRIKGLDEEVGKSVNCVVENMKTAFSADR